MVRVGLVTGSAGITAKISVGRVHVHLGSSVILRPILHEKQGQTTFFPLPYSPTPVTALALRQADTNGLTIVSSPNRCPCCMSSE